MCPLAILAQNLRNNRPLIKTILEPSQTTASKTSKLPYLLFGTLTSIVLSLNPCLALTNPVDLSALQKPIIEAEQHNLKTDNGQEMMLQVIADEINYNNNTDFYEAKGNAEAYVPDKDATLYADLITYNGQTKLVEAFGNVKMIQDADAAVTNESNSKSKKSATSSKTTIYGTYSSFHIDSSLLDISSPRVFLRGVKLKAREATGKLEDKEEGKEQKKNIKFFDGTLATEEPITMYLKGFRIGTRYSQDSIREDRQAEHNWDELPEKATFKYSAKEIVYDDTKRVNNLRIKGARIWLNDHFSIPSPVHITTTVGDVAGSKFMGPVIGTQERIGGFALGPRFIYAPENNLGVFGIAPILQIGDGADFGFGVIGSYSNISDTTRLMGGYGTLDDRWILNAHQKLPWNFEVNVLKNQFLSNAMFGSTLVGEFAEVAHHFKIKAPFIDRRGIRFNNSIGIAKDNAELFSSKRLDDLRETRSEAGLAKGNADLRDFRSEHSVNFYTNPLYRYGNEEYNVALSLRAQGALRFYGTGDHLAIARFGPALETRLSKLAFEVDYLFATVDGASPFLFDQFIDGEQSIVFDGDYQFSKWLSIGTFLTYNLDTEHFVRNQVRAMIGAEDFKLIISYDTILNQLGLGFNMIMADPLKFDTLTVKTQ